MKRRVICIALAVLLGLLTLWGGAYVDYMLSPGDWRKFPAFMTTCAAGAAAVMLFIVGGRP